jgi:hypothetical protein
VRKSPSSTVGSKKLGMKLSLKSSLCHCWGMSESWW